MKRIWIFVLALLLSGPALGENDWCQYHAVGCDRDSPREDGTRVYAWRKWERERPRPDYRIEVRRRAAIERERERREARERRLRRDREETREYGYLPVPSRHALCLAPVSVVGSQHITEAGAEESAAKGWAEQVRFSSGEQFMNLPDARDYAKRCTRSSIGEIAGQTLHRCQIVARPCRPALELKDDGK